AYVGAGINQFVWSEDSTATVTNTGSLEVVADATAVAESGESAEADAEVEAGIYQLAIGSLAEISNGATMAFSALASASAASNADVDAAVLGADQQAIGSDAA